MNIRKYPINCGIYKIVSPSGRIYIGQSTDIFSRIRSYRSGKCEKQTFLSNSIKKYGWRNHKFLILEICKPEELNSLEVYYIKIYGSFNSKKGLNLRSGGNANSKMSVATKNRLSKSLRKAKRILKYGRSNHASRQVKQFDLDGNLLREWDCINDIQKELGFNRPNICKCCKGKIFSAYGFKWQYTNEFHTTTLKKCGETQKKIVYQYSLSGNLIKEWIGLKDAAVSVEGQGAGISRACGGYYQQAYGYMWIWHKYEAIPPFIKTKHHRSYHE